MLRPRHNSISRVEALVKTSRGRKVMTSPDRKLLSPRLDGTTCNPHLASSREDVTGLCLEDFRNLWTNAQAVLQCHLPGKLISNFRLGPDQADAAQCFERHFSEPWACKQKLKSPHGVSQNRVAQPPGHRCANSIRGMLNCEQVTQNGMPARGVCKRKLSAR